MGVALPLTQKVALIPGFCLSSNSLQPNNNLNKYTRSKITGHGLEAGKKIHEKTSIDSCSAI